MTEKIKLANTERKKPTSQISDNKNERKNYREEVWLRGGGKKVGGVGVGGGGLRIRVSSRDKLGSRVLAVKKGLRGKEVGRKGRRMRELYVRWLGTRV